MTRSLSESPCVGVFFNFLAEEHGCVQDQLLGGNHGVHFYDKITEFLFVLSSEIRDSRCEMTASVATGGSFV